MRAQAGAFTGRGLEGRGEDGLRAHKDATGTSHNLIYSKNLICSVERRGMSLRSTSLPGDTFASEVLGPLSSRVYSPLPWNTPPGKFPVLQEEGWGNE